jgi:F-type H+-transporting ATPase subunit b
MKISSKLSSALFAAAFVASSTLALANEEHAEGSANPSAQVAGAEHGAAEHGAAEHGAAEHGGDAHEGAHAAGHGHHDPTFADVNWFYGFLGEKEGVEPSLLYRKPGMPIPVGVLLLNTAILFFILGRIGGPAIGQALVDRKKRIAGDIEAASKMKEEATAQLATYEGKLAEMASEMERITADMREHAKSERERILREAAQRRESLEKEARQLIEAELAHARQEMAKSAAKAAVKLAQAQLEKSLTADDHERLSKEFLGGLEKRVEVRS